MLIKGDRFSQAKVKIVLSAIADRFYWAKM